MRRVGYARKLHFQVSVDLFLTLTCFISWFVLCLNYHHIVLIFIYYFYDELCQMQRCRSEVRLSLPTVVLLSCLITLVSDLLIRT